MPWLLLSVLLLGADRLTKWWAVAHLPLNAPSPLVGNVIRLTYVHNSGGIFGLLPGNGTAFIAVSAVAAAVVLGLLLTRRIRGLLLRPGLALVLAGALGNLIDRAAYGYVIDFFEVRGFPIFNVADSCITVGALLIVAHVLWGGDRDRP